MKKATTHYQVCDSNIIKTTLNLPNTVKFWFKFSSVTEERISSVVAKIIYYKSFKE